MTTADSILAGQPIIGMVHLQALPGAPQFDGDLAAVLERAVADATALEAGGVDGIMIENFGDTPFYPESVPPETVAAMTRVGTAITEAVSVPVGINVLRNDPSAALAIACALSGSFIRVNVHLGARVTDQGLIEGQAHETLRKRSTLAPDVDILADVAVKHSQPVSGNESLATTVHDHLERGLVDGLIVSGAETGTGPATAAVADVCRLVEEHDRSVPVLIGSGLRPETAPELIPPADGAIVGTALKENGTVTAPVAVDRVKDVVRAVKHH